MSATVTAQEFLRELLKPAPAGAVAWCASLPTLVTDKRDWTGEKVAIEALPDFSGVNAYYSVAAFREAATARETAQSLGATVVIVDDVGTKARAEEVRERFGEPSFRIATSTGNEQWGYFLDRLATKEEIRRILRRLVALKLCDPNGNNPVRYGRLPAGHNDKPEHGAPFTVHCAEWAPERRYTVAIMTARCGANEPAPSSAERMKSDELEEQILSGEALHEPLTQLAARLRLRGYAHKHIVAVLRDLMERSEVRGTERWRERSEDIERTVATAFEKPQFERAPPVDILQQTVAPPFTAAEVPALIGNWAEAWGHAAGFDPSGPIVAAVVTTAAALDDGIQLEVARNTEWRESARLWAALVGPPGMAKTPAIRAATAPLVELHKELVNEYAARTRGMDPKKEELPPLPALVSHDATLEKLTEVLRDNPRGLLYHTEELDAWLGSHDAYRAGDSSKDRGEWLQLFDGGGHQVDRVRRGSYFVPNWGVSLISATTPDALRRLTKKLTNDGLLQRVLPVLIGVAGAPDPAISADKPRAALTAAVEAVHKHRADYRVVKLSAGASALFEAELLRTRELAVACGAISASLAGHVAKYATFLARVALAFHALESPAQHPAERELSVDTMRLAQRFMARAFLHARAFYRDLTGGDEAFDIAQRVARWLVAAQPPVETVSRAKIMQRGAFGSAGEMVQSAAMRILEDFGWVSPLPGAYQKAHTTWWAVDQRIYELFAGVGEAHRRARALVREAILGTHSASPIVENIDGQRTPPEQPAIVGPTVEELNRVTGGDRM